MKNKGLSLVELIVAMATVFIVLGALSSIVVFYLNVQKKISGSPLVDTALTLETAVQSIFRAVNISDTDVVQIEDDGKTMVWKTQEGKLKRLKFNAAEAKLYYDEDYNEGKKSALSGKAILSDTKDVSFSQDTNVGTVLLEVKNEYEPTAAAACVTDGKTSVKKEVCMQTAIRPKLAKSLCTEKPTVFQNCSPAIEGVLVEVKRENGKVFAVMEAHSIAMHTPEGFLNVNKETISVEVLPSLPVQDYVGQRVMFNGDVAARKDSRIMVMNLMYAGGMVTGEQNINDARQRILDGKEDWYNRQTANLKDCFVMAGEKGVPLNDWKKLWDWMVYYYDEYFSSLEKKGSVKVTYPIR
ncbi:MAG: prepilin-type N-terminal cleavage/methylation domain-containing protein [Candidatus Omnitrophota bacterium]|jgi:hypothetical protein